MLWTHGSGVGVAGGRIHGPNRAKVACQQSAIAVWVTVVREVTAFVTEVTESVTEVTEFVTEVIRVCDRGDCMSDRGDRLTDREVTVSGTRDL